MGNLASINTTGGSNSKPPILHQSLGGRKQTIDDYNMGVYATGGNNLTAQAAGLGNTGRIYVAKICGKQTSTYRYDVIYPASGPNQTVKIIAYVVATGAEVANAVDLSAERLRIEVIGQQ